MISLDGDIVLIDGEFRNGRLFDRIVGLFPVDEMIDAVDSGCLEFRPARHFFHGRPHRDASQLEANIDEYLENLKTNRLRRPSDLDAYKRTERRFDLCPVTRSMISRYAAWRETSKDQKMEISDNDWNKYKGRAEAAQIFISHKSEDALVARALSDYLAHEGLEVFFCEYSLRDIGESNYASAIHDALDRSQCLVVIGTRPEHLVSGWVEYEWSSFLCEMNSGRKKDGDLFVFIENISPSELPYALRSRQIVPYSSSSPHDSFADLHRYIASKVRCAGQ